MIKLICNCHTDLIYGFGNEVAMMAEKYGLDPIELINSANLKYPRPDLNLPGFVGGGCLSKDPYILMSSFDVHGYTPQLVKAARNLNERMPFYIAEKVIEGMHFLKKNPNEVKIFVAGFAYKGKPVTDDIRGSPAMPFVEYLKRYSPNIYGHDFLVPDNRIREMGAIPCSLEEGFKGADCAVFLNNHPDYRSMDIVALVKEMKRPSVLYDCWRLFDLKQINKIKDVVYGSIGFGG